MDYTGKVNLFGKEYPVKVVDGERLTKVGDRWLTSDEFVESLSPEKIDSLAFVGRIALRDERLGVEPEKGKYQYIAQKLDDPLKEETNNPH